MSESENVCKHNTYSFVKTVDFFWKGKNYEIYVDRCEVCGKYVYSYDNLILHDWKSVSDVKDYIRNKKR